MTVEQIAADFGVHSMTLWKWLQRAKVEGGEAVVQTSGESETLRELCKRNRLLEQQNEVLRRVAAYLPHANLRGKGSTRS